MSGDAWKRIAALWEEKRNMTDIGGGNPGDPVDDDEDCECLGCLMAESEDVSGYEDLRRILNMAYDQAARGKGKERHGVKGEVWSRQPIIRHQLAFGPGFALGQAAKKMEEAQFLDSEAAKFEILGAIVYAAAAIRFFEVKDDALCKER